MKRQMFRVIAKHPLTGEQLFYVKLLGYDALDCRACLLRVLSRIAEQHRTMGLTLNIHPILRWKNDQWEPRYEPFRNAR